MQQKKLAEKNNKAWQETRMMLKRIQQMNKFEQRLQEENEACDSKI